MMCVLAQPANRIVISSIIARANAVPRVNLNGVELRLNKTSVVSLSEVVRIGFAIR